MSFFFSITDFFMKNTGELYKTNKEQDLFEDKASEYIETPRNLTSKKVIKQSWRVQENPTDTKTQKRNHTEEKTLERCYR